MTAHKNEPTYETAAGWWPEMPNKWTVLGVRDHVFKTAVYWNGATLVDTCCYGRVWDERIGGQGIMITPRGRFESFDDGTYRQGWTGNTTPVLWTEWQDAGILLRQEVFVCTTPDWDASPEPHRAGLEPVFTWMRCSIAYCCPGLPLEDTYTWKLCLNKPAVWNGMVLRNNTGITHGQSRYPRRLRSEKEKGAWRALEKGNRVRLGIEHDASAQVSLHLPKKGQTDTFIDVRIPVREGASFDILVPFVPEKREVFDARFAVGFDGDLARTDGDWADTPRTAASFHVPEKPVCEALNYNMQVAQILGERYTDQDLTGFVVGYPQYARLWGTPGAMQVCWLLDAFGYHDTVVRYLEMFKKHQGDVTPPGSAYSQHPGYLAVPPWLKSIDWVSDHGAILYAMCMHALYTNDTDATASFLPAIVKACDWIKDSRAIKNHKGMPGLLPPAVATDKMTEIQSVWGEGWNYKGLSTAVRLLKQLDHPRAAEFEKEAVAHRAAFRKSFSKRRKAMPVWTDDRGVKHHLPPTSLAADAKEETRHPFYLDGGPLFLVFSGLMSADEEPMRATLEWFRNGPVKRMHRPGAWRWCMAPMLEHEMSSIEPCYSWNLFHSHQLGDRQHFLEGMYSLWAGGHSKETYTSCETRGGITGTAFAAAMAAYTSRLAVIDDELKADELHLLRLVPSAWLAPGKACRFLKMPTVFGPVTLRTKRSRDGKALRIDVKTRFHHPPRRTVVHLPQKDGIEQISLNGQVVPPNKRRISL